MVMKKFVASYIIQVFGIPKLFFNKRLNYNCKKIKDGVLTRSPKPIASGYFEILPSNQ